MKKKYILAVILFLVSICGIKYFDIVTKYCL